MKSLQSRQITFLLFFKLLPQFSKAEPTGPVGDIGGRSGHQHAGDP